MNNQINRYYKDFDLKDILDIKRVFIFKWFSKYELFYFKHLNFYLKGLSGILVGILSLLVLFI